MRGRARSSKSSSSDLVVGRLGRAVGLRGEIELTVVSDDPGRFATGSVVYAPGGRALTVRALRLRGARTIVAFEEVTTRTGAEELRGAELVIPHEQARSLEEGEYWDHDLVGCTVVTTEGREVGVVSDVLHQPANEVLVVDAEEGEVLVPLVAAVIRGVEPGRRITIEQMHGLIDR